MSNNVNNNYINQEEECMEEWFKSFPTGFRFKPHDDELIDHYLKPKLLNSELPPNKIVDVELYNYNPDELVALYESYGEGEWYFFTPRKKKYPNGSRPARGAGDGYWKATGADKIIKSKDGVEIGRKKALVFFAGKGLKAQKTDWIMHEYKLLDPPLISNRSQDNMQLDDWILCKIYKNKASKEKTLVVPAAANVGTEELGILPTLNRPSIDIGSEQVQVRLPPTLNGSSIFDIRSEQFQARFPPTLNGPSIFDIGSEQFQAHLPPTLNGPSIFDVGGEYFQARLPPTLNGPSILDIESEQFQVRIPSTLNGPSIFDIGSEQFQVRLPPTLNGPSIFDIGREQFQVCLPPTLNGPSIFDIGSEHVQVRLPPTLIGPSTNIGREQVQVHLPPTLIGPSTDAGSKKSEALSSSRALAAFYNDMKTEQNSSSIFNDVFVSYGQDPEQGDMVPKPYSTNPSVLKDNF